MKISKVTSYIVALIMPMVATEVAAEESVCYEASLTAGIGSGTFSPYYLSALRHGRFTQSRNLQAELAIWKDVDVARRFSYGFGVDVIGGPSSSTSYERYSAELGGWYSHPERPAALWLQQLYAEIKYRSLFLEIGLREQSSALLNQRLTSGDLIESGNTRPMPQIRAGFIDFQNIPFTNGWLQISGEGAFGYMMDDGWWKSHYNYYSSHIAIHQWYNYKRAYFRTKPSMPFSVTFGMQAAATFAGISTLYSKGVVTKVESHPKSLKYFLKMILPTQDGGEGFYSGNHLGTWDIRMRYRLKNNDEIFAYTSWLWDDGSGIGKLNGWDGLWGLEYKAASSGYVTGAVAEYFDFTNQSGPIHFNSADAPGCNIPAHASGADDYYNNASYNSFAYFGLSLGTPVMMAPLYNRDGYPNYIGNAVRGFHVGIEGFISSELTYRMKGGYRKAWGTPKKMLKTPIHLTSVMVEANWTPKRVKGLSLTGAMEVDRGTMPSNAFGVMVGVRYDGMFNFRK